MLRPEPQQESRRKAENLGEIEMGAFLEAADRQAGRSIQGQEKDICQERWGEGFV